MRLSITRAAMADIDEAWVYLATEAGIEAANRVRNSFSKTFSLLLRVPFAGRSREQDLTPGLRSIPSGRYVVFYRVETDALRIVRVLHGKQDAMAILSEE
jgi:toxin ParE1/3/4